MKLRVENSEGLEPEQWEKVLKQWPVGSTVRAWSANGYHALVVASDGGNDVSAKYFLRPAYASELSVDPGQYTSLELVSLHNGAIGGF